jgi:hypothetical protein
MPEWQESFLSRREGTGWVALLFMWQSSLCLRVARSVRSYRRRAAEAILLRFAGAPASHGLSPAGSKLYCFNAGNLAAFDPETQNCPDMMPAIVSASAGIHVHETERPVAHDFQDVGVTADEQTGPEPLDFLPRAPVVIARIPSDVGHVNCDALAIPNEIRGNFGTEFRSVDVPVSAPDRSEGAEPMQNLNRPEVASVPNLVAFGEMPENSVVQKSVCVG